VFSNIFSVLFDSFIENDRFNEAVQNSMDSYNEELFRKKEELLFFLFWIIMVDFTIHF
jgi:hypothetical protein